MHIILYKIRYITILCYLSESLIVLLQLDQLLQLFMNRKNKIVLSFRLFIKFLKPVARKECPNIDLLNGTTLSGRPNLARHVGPFKAIKIRKLKPLYMGK